jgi:hypothetical protein
MSEPHIIKKYTASDDESDVSQEEPNVDPTNSENGEYGDDSAEEEPYFIPATSGVANQHIEVSTEGITHNDMAYSKLGVSANLLKYCEMCGKFYSDDMICYTGLDKESLLKNKKQNDDGTMCWHCFFWLNYDVSNRSVSDGVYGMTIAEYVLKCKDEHNTETCTRRTQHGGCFLCEYLLEFPIIDIRDAHLLYDTEISDDCHFATGWDDTNEKSDTEYDNAGEYTIDL